ncbi:hypothetical protein [Streptomyces aidingensis]|uniref:Uncharacterized protein n=1 Tax=Streptomyces aidingensis TaxID=910347 RepID=A0A1I1R2Z1_9ACTN|nr:hypothetical protein [Streptomyces aidingensis]SFD25903.1 hypothetical protein SAMN05421773_11220 [Streptomyces aidingensis]
MSRHLPGAAPRPGRRAAAVLLGCALTAAGTGCQALGITGPERYEESCGVLVDGSGSAQPYPEGFDGEILLDETLPDFLADRTCRTLSFGPITNASAGSTCRAEPLDLDPDGDAHTDREELRASLRAAALGRARELLACARSREPGSDVLGALDRVAGDRPGGDGTLHLLVISDFRQYDTEFRVGEHDLTTPESRAAVLDLLAEDGRLPDLSGVRVYPVGYGMRMSDEPGAYGDFDAFWTELLEGRSGADVDHGYRN